MSGRATLFAVCVIGMTTAACNQAPTESAKAKAPGAAPMARPQENVIKPETYSRSIYSESAKGIGAETVVSLVSSVSLDFLDLQGTSAMIRAAGMAARGSTSAALTPIEEEAADASVKKFKFVALANTGGQTEEAAIYVRLTVDLPPSVKTIQVVAERNTTSVQIVRPDEIIDLAATP